MTATTDKRWARVGGSMAAGAAYDAAFAFAILALPRLAAGWLRLPAPDDLTYLRFNGVFLAMLAALYLFAAREPQRYRGVVVVAAAGRFAGFLYLAAVWYGGGSPTFLVLAFADLAFAAVHAELLRRACK